MLVFSAISRAWLLAGGCALCLWKHQSLQMATGKGQGWGVSETMESASRWSGYVCPDCRFVFRVPRDHDGKGIICPSCRRMLRIPTSADETAALDGRQRVEGAEKRVVKKAPPQKEGGFVGARMGAGKRKGAARAGVRSGRCV